MSLVVIIIRTVTLKGEHRLRVFENRVLRRTFGPRREEVAGDWRSLHNEELHNLCASPNIIRVIELRRMRGAGHVARMGKMGNACNVFVGKPERKGPLRRRRCRLEDNIRMDIREVGWKGVDWMHVSVQGPVMDCCNRGNELSDFIKEGEFLDHLIEY
jgi:hypothetical protein